MTGTPRVFNPISKRDRPIWRRVAGGIIFGFLTAGELAASALITVAWDANPEPDIAGYRLYYGTSVEVYDEMIEVGNATSVVVVGLVPGETYHFAATAYNTDGLESFYSEEISFFAAPPAGTKITTITEATNLVAPLEIGPLKLPTLAIAWTKKTGPGTVQFTTPALLETNATFSEPGVYTIVVTATDLTGFLRDEQIIRVDDRMAAWQSRRGIVDLNSDDDLDGYTAILEYAMGTSPHVWDSPFAPTVTNGRLTVFYPRRTTASDVTLRVQIGDSPGGPWRAGTTWLIQNVIEEVGDIQSMRVRDRDLLGTVPARFMRLQVVEK